MEVLLGWLTEWKCYWDG